MCFQLLHSTEHWSWISSASVVTSQRLRHIQLLCVCVYMGGGVSGALRLHCLCACCCLCGGVCIRASHASPCPLNVKVVLLPKWVVAELQEHWLENVWVHPHLLSVCAGNGSVSRRRFWAVEKGIVIGFHWNLLTHETKQSVHVEFATCQGDEL